MGGAGGSLRCGECGQSFASTPALLGVPVPPETNQADRAASGGPKNPLPPPLPPSAPPPLKAKKDVPNVAIAAGPHLPRKQAPSPPQRRRLSRVIRWGVFVLLIFAAGGAF